MGCAANVKRKTSHVARGSAVVLLMLAIAASARAQQWNDQRALTLVRQATELRARQLADTGLVDYHAKAHGYVTFLAQLGEGFREPPQVVKADELALEVYWRAPNLSKQRIVGRRDTTLLPTDIQYHRDHLGIVQNNFPAIIRLGEGDEVQDVPHPLSAAGLREYDFALTDSLRISIPGRVIAVYEVKVRPKDDRKPRVIGALYIDRDDVQVVRMALSFTRAAFLDKLLEDLFIVLENGLVGTRFWLPRRQEIEIRRSATWLDYPVRGIIRGRWEIGEYVANAGIPRSFFIGAEIVDAPRAVQQLHTWPSAHILDSLPPDIRAVTADEIRRVQTEVRTLVREQALRRARTSALSARGISDFVTFNRVEGVALGVGFSGRLGAGFGLAARGRHGFADDANKGKVELTWQNARGVTLRAFGENDFRDVGDFAERSRLVNSLAAQEFSSDFTDPYTVESFGAGLELPWRGARWSATLANESQRPLALHATAVRGTFRLPVGAAYATGTRATLAADLPTTLTALGFEVRGRLEGAHFDKTAIACAGFAVDCGPGTRTVRGDVVVELERPFSAARLVTRTIGGAVSASDALLAQDLVFLGGPMSAPGYTFHELIGEAALSQRIELQLPTPFIGFSLGRFGRAPARATIAPFVNGVLLRTAESGRAMMGLPAPNASDPYRPRESGFYPSAGVGLQTFFDLLRFDVARGLRDGRWIFSVDVNRAFWVVM